MKPVLFVMCCVVVTGQATWSDLNTQGIRFYARGQFGPAEVKFRAALLQAEQFEQSDYRLTANLSNLALVLQEQGDLAAAEKLYRRVLELREKYLKPESAEIAATLNNIGTVLHTAGRDVEADPIVRRGLLIAENAHDEIATAAALNTLGLVLMGQNENARAEPVLRRALAVFERAQGPDSLDVGKTANNLAAIYSHDGEYGKAEEMQRFALPRYRKNLPLDHPLLATVLNNMFAILGAQKRFDEAEPYLREALEIAEKTDRDSPRMLQYRGNLATLQASRGKWQAAAETLQGVIAAEERLLGPNDPKVAAALENYSEALKRLNHKSEAKQAQQRANQIMKSFRP